MERFDKTYSLTPSDVTHTVLEGETLPNIANKYYKDSGRWGDIATINEIIDPFDLTPGMKLVIPL
ncbi:MAG: LysM peptidoglycan-binding domain-containing protein [Roseburia sp.]|nr:LysM peptidoglycan-binding domain-containing protein [Roseburia sp.]